MKPSRATRARNAAPVELMRRSPPRWRAEEPSRSHRVGCNAILPSLSREATWHVPSHALEESRGHALGESKSVRRSPHTAV